MFYFGKMPDDNLAIRIGKDSTFDDLLSKGYHIYQMDDNGNQTEIANPEEGFLSERPIVTRTDRTGDDLIRAIRIIMGTDEEQSIKSSAGTRTLNLKKAELSGVQETNISDGIDLISEAYAFRAKLDQLLEEVEK